MSDDVDSDFIIDERFLNIAEEVFLTSYMVNGPETNSDIPNDINPAHLFGPIRIARLHLEINKELREVIDEFEKRNEELQEQTSMFSLTEGHKEARVAMALSDKIFGYFALVAALIEHYSIELLQQELIDEEYRRTNKTERLLRWSMNQEVRESLLLRTGVIENGLHSDLSDIRDIRNSFVHDPEYRLFLKRGGEVTDDMDTAFNVIQELAQIATNDRAFTFEIDKH